MFLRANRIKRAWLIVLPPAAAYLCLVGMKIWVKPLFEPYAFGEVAYIFQELLSNSGLIIMGLAAVLLLGHKLSTRNRLVAFLQVAVIMIAAAVLMELSQSGFSYFNRLWITIVFDHLSILCLLFGVAISFLLSARSFSVRSFMMRLPLWMLLASVTVMFAHVGAIWLFTGWLRYYPGNILSTTVLIGASMALVSYVVVLPFMVLSFASRFYRDRLYAVLRLKGMTSAGEQVTNQGTSSISD